jgi:hypothetical protein
VKDYPNAEFVILDYGDDNGIEGRTIKQWLMDTYPQHIASGRIRYARTEQTHFKMAHAKNMAHRLGTGDVLVNLDADNVMGTGFAEWLDKKFRENEDTLARVVYDNPFKKVLFPKYTKGLDGRIAVSVSNFHLIGGYDEEQHNGYTGDDDYFTSCAKLHGLTVIKADEPLWGHAIRHNDTARLASLEPNEQRRSGDHITARNQRGRDPLIVKAARHAKRQVCKNPTTRSLSSQNSYGVGEATLLLPNRKERIELFTPVDHPLWRENLKKDGFEARLDAELNGRGPYTGRS